MTSLPVHALVVMPCSHRGPETMTAAEQAALLWATAEEPRDHVLYSMALGTGLRLSELVGLNVGDVSPDGRGVPSRYFPSAHPPLDRPAGPACREPLDALLASKPIRHQVPPR